MIKIINDKRQCTRQHVTAEILIRNDPSIGKRSRPRPEEASRSFGKVNKPRSIPTTIAEPRFSLCSMPICVVLILPSVVPRFPPIRPTSFHSTTASFSSTRSLHRPTTPLQSGLISRSTCSTFFLHSIVAKLLSFSLFLCRFSFSFEYRVRCPFRSLTLFHLVSLSLFLSLSLANNCSHRHRRSSSRKLRRSEGSAREYENSLGETSARRGSARPVFRSVSNPKGVLLCLQTRASWRNHEWPMRGNSTIQRSNQPLYLQRGMIS